MIFEFIYMNWRLKRQLIAIGILGLLMAIAAFSLFFWFRGSVREEKPLVLSNVESLRLLWSRFFLVRQGVYDVAALLENPNERAKATAIPYVFRLFDERDVLIAAKEGIGVINPGERFVIVEPLVATGVRVPQRVSFEIREVAWQAGEKRIPPLVVKSRRFETNGMNTTVHAMIAHTDVRPSAILEAVAVLADEEGNAIAVARSRVDPLAAGEEREVVFTWPRVLPEPNAIQIFIRES